MKYEAQIEAAAEHFKKLLADQLARVDRINAAGEAAGNYNEEDVLKKVNNIYNTVERILTESQKTGEPEGVIAERFAEECIWGAK